MLFNSLEFTIFLPLVFLLYWFVFRGLRIQNIFLVVSSYFFYGWWDWRFLFLILFSSLVDYFVGLKLLGSENIKHRKLLLLTSLIVNLGMLGFFKYYNFFLDSFTHAFTFFGTHIEPNRLKIILPVGISFYTFQTLSYTIDVYRKKIEPTKDILAFLAFVSFFPQLVAGPIERASNLLPQFFKKRVFNYNLAVNGSFQIIGGFFKKMVIADNCSPYVNDIFANYQNMEPSILFLGAFFFAFQIYCDFSGYSDIAIGTGKLFGFQLMKNFSFPYFSRDIAEFWRRWHISLSSWFRDYVYIPIGGSRGSKLMSMRNVLVIFIVSGFWHGANWTFIAWGAIHAMYFLPLYLIGANRHNLNIVAENRLLPSPKEIVQMTYTFFIVLVAWIFFRAGTVEIAWHYVMRMIDIDLFSVPNRFRYPLIFIGPFVLLEWLQRKKHHFLDITGFKPIIQIVFGTMIILMIALFGVFVDKSQFIYFQF